MSGGIEKVRSQETYYRKDDSDSDKEAEAPEAGAKSIVPIYQLEEMKQSKLHEKMEAYKKKKEAKQAQKQFEREQVTQEEYNRNLEETIKITQQIQSERLRQQKEDS